MPYVMKWSHTLRLCSLQLDGRVLYAQMLPMDTKCSPRLDIVVNCRKTVGKVEKCGTSASMEERKSDNFIKLKLGDKGTEDSMGTHRHFLSDNQITGK